MRHVWITDAAAVTALGDTLDASWQGLMEGMSAVKPVNSFYADTYSKCFAACIDNLARQNGRSMMYSLIDRLLGEIEFIPEDSLLITATTKSGIDNLELICRGASANSGDILLSYLSEVVAEKTGLINNGVNISAACASSTVAIAQGASWIANGQADAVLVCCIDLVTEFVLSGFSALQALSHGPCKPFDRDRSGLSLGEGAAALLLMSDEQGRKENREPLGTIHGWGIANDAAHITAPARDGSGLIQAINLALCNAKLEAEDIAGISAHGTGTVYNDIMELTAFSQVFGNVSVPPVHSVKGAIGHTLGAAGGIEAAVALKSLSRKIIPPTAGFINPEKGAAGCVSANPAELAGNYMLTTNSGFGGINAALILGREADCKSITKSKYDLAIGRHEISKPLPAARITGIGWVFPGGMDSGKSGFEKMGRKFSEKIGQLPLIKRKEVFTKPYKHFGRMDSFSRLGLAAIAFALKDAGLEEWTEKRNIGVIVSSVYGCLNTDIDYFRTVIPEKGALASPNLFAYTLPNSFLGEAAILFGMTGETFVVSI